MSPSTSVPRPFSILAELTHRCPLHCPYCSNPLELAKRENELGTEDWKRALGQAAELGVLHVGFSGGEPLLRTDLAALIAAGRQVGLYSNLITSGLVLTPQRATELKNAGLDSIQISFQADEAPLADNIAGAKAHQKKLAAAQTVRELGFPLTVNVVLHRRNIDRLDKIVELAEGLSAERLELANTQYYGWAFRNRSALLPTRAQIAQATRITQDARKRLFGKMEILFVVPDYYSDRPKPCMHGWGTRHITINPAGDVLPCPTAGGIPGMKFENVRSQSLQSIWTDSEAFNRFRGTDWMPDPCRGCEFREKDFGGCRCQASLLTGDPSATDPVCSLSRHHQELTALVESLQGAEDRRDWTYRQNPGS
jgi:pyrroloquinoline quinone biosynthesis protein E